MAKHQVPRMVVRSQHQPADRHKAHGNDPNIAALHHPAINRVAAAAAAHRIVTNGQADRQAHHHTVVSILRIDPLRMHQAQVAAHIRVATIGAAVAEAAAVDHHTIRHRINRRRHRRVDIIREMTMMIGTKRLMLGSQRHVIEAANQQFQPDKAPTMIGMPWQMRGAQQLHQRALHRAMVMNKIKHQFIIAAKVHVR